MKRWWWLALAGFLLAACGTPIAAPAPATLQPLTVIHPPLMQPWLDDLARCAARQPGLALYRVESTTPVEVQDGEILLWWGIPPQGQSTFQLGEDSLSVIVHTSHGKIALSQNELAGLFSGETARWEDGSLVQAWVYPADDPLWQAFDLALGGVRPTPDALIAPDPLAMVDAVGADPAAIGLLPTSWLGLSDSITPVELNTKLAEKLRQPVTATLSEMPVGAMQTWLVCLQSQP